MRVTRIERLLPELATKKDLAAAVAPLATKQELLQLRADIRASFATKEELRAAIAELRTDLMATLAPRVLMEALDDKLKVILDAVRNNTASIEALQREMHEGFRSLDHRVMRLEARARLEPE